MVAPNLPFELTVDAARGLSAYLHIPFCAVRCGYCDFNTYTAGELRGFHSDDYAGVLRSEITQARSLLSAAGDQRAIQTVFFGGGTPTLLPAADLAEMLEALRQDFGLLPGVEVTVEANPDTVTPEVVDTLANAGVTRFSLGMQSAVPHVLQVLDRTHRPEGVPAAVQMVRAAGLGVSVDLIYGSPSESLDDWERSLDEAISYQPDHVSAYALIVENGTRLARQIRRGELATPSDDLQAQMYELADAKLADAGMSWYELSNWARRESDQSRHNIAYWRGDDWWGFGPGAHSHIGGVRWWNVKHPAAYAQRLSSGQSPIQDFEKPDEHQRQLERVLLQSRLSEGLPISALNDRSAVAGLIADGLVEAKAALAGQVRLTLRGRLLADAVVRALT